MGMIKKIKMGGVGGEKNTNMDTDTGGRWIHPGGNGNGAGGATTPTPTPTTRGRNEGRGAGATETHIARPPSVLYLSYIDIDIEDRDVEICDQ